jgi:hypothetical protein
MKLIGTAIDQNPTGENGNHRVGCRTAMWKERRNHNKMISKQQLKYYDEAILSLIQIISSNECTVY